MALPFPTIVLLLLILIFYLSSARLMEIKCVHSLSMLQQLLYLCPLPPMTVVALPSVCVTQRVIVIARAGTPGLLVAT